MGGTLLTVTSLIGLFLLILFVEGMLVKVTILIGGMLIVGFCQEALRKQRIRERRRKKAAERKAPASKPVICWFFVPVVGGLMAPPLTSAQRAIPEATRALAMWAPLSIEQQGVRLVITAKERQVSQTVYTAMIYAGICLFAGTGRIQLAGITEIIILNRFRGAGWVFEGGKKECRQIAEASSARRDVLIWSQTHMY